jgi:pimeloyl-ACP methyl ester carboxylesterase
MLACCPGPARVWLDRLCRAGATTARRWPRTCLRCSTSSGWTGSRPGGHAWRGWIGFVLSLRRPERIRHFAALNIVPPWSSISLRNLLEGRRFAYQIPLALPQLGRWAAEHGLARLALCTGADAFSEREIVAFTDRLKGERARASELLYPTFLLREAVPVFAGRYARLPFGVPTRLLVGERTLLFRPEQAASTDALELELVQGPGTSSWTRSQSS